MRIREIMTRSVETVTQQASAASTWERMRQARIHHLVVVEGAGTIVGVISERDLGGPRGRSLREDTVVGELMVEAPVTVDPEMYVKDAANLMRGRSIGCLPVCDERGKLVGIVTVSDLLEAIGRSSERPVVQGKRWTLKHRGPRHPHT